MPMAGTADGDRRPSSMSTRRRKRRRRKTKTKTRREVVGRGATGVGRGKNRRRKPRSPPPLPLMAAVAAAAVPAVEGEAERTSEHVFRAAGAEVVGSIRTATVRLAEAAGEDSKAGVNKAKEPWAWGPWRCRWAPEGHRK